MDNTIINQASDPGQSIATKDINGVNHEQVLLEFSDGSGGATEVAALTPLPVTDNAAELSLASIDLKLASPATIFNGKTTVTTSGTRVALASSQVVKSVTIKAALANTGTIYVGNSSVSSSNGFELAAGDTISLDIANLTTINIDASINSQSVTYIANA